MSHIKEIQIASDHHCFVVDACVLVDAALATVLPSPENPRQEQTKEWWDRLHDLALAGESTIYIPDICIAEAFKVVAKKTWVQELLNHPQKTKVETLLRDWVTIDTKMLKNPERIVPVHDISTNRDIIISVDRFLKTAITNGCKSLTVPDLIVAATAKYLIDFYNFRKEALHIVTNDQRLAKLIRACEEFMAPIEPEKHQPDKILVSGK